MGIRFGESAHVLQVIEPHNWVNAVHRAGVDLDLANWVTFIVSYGAVTTGSTSDTFTISVEATSVNSTAAGTAIPFAYRLSSALATDSWGTITAGTSDGVSFQTSDLESSTLLISVNPADIPARGEKYHWAMFVSTPGSSLACTGSVVAVIEPRYPANSPASST